ncbi:AraC family transcriptional regulator [Hoeflea sp. WL0058]|uniref:AraC family transcriptional regulator n=1 Tax=Flavimaribacter sediminis TaxID=2865987 RepID=A0AAE2ZM83_9HYPH|nr:AraC family transcriptional regulator [Flavimaribacter sediminis]
MPRITGSIPLARLRGIGTLPCVVEERTGEDSLIRILRSVGLPLEALDHPDLPIPVSLISDLFASSADKLGDRTLGVRIGKSMTHEAWGSWTGRSAQAPNLKIALQRLCLTIGAHLSSARMTLQQEDGYWIWRYTPPLRRDRITQYSDHLIYPMLTFAQVYLGSNWRPAWVEVNYPRDSSVQLIETLLRTSLRCGGDGIALPLSAEDLVQPHPVEMSIVAGAQNLREITADLVLGDAPEPARSFSAVVSLRLLEGKSDIEGASQMTGLGVQGLQRRLRSHGYTYQKILDAARCDRAVTLLTQTGLSVAEIAYSLGYDEHASFTRAFNRWIGCSPNIFRANSAN